MEKDKAPKTVAVGRIVINSIRKLQGKDGVSLPALKKFLRDAKNIDTGVHDAEIKLSMKSAIDRGLLLKEGGNYKVKAARRRRSRRSKSPRSRRRRRTASPRRRRRRTTGSHRSRSRRRRSSGRKRSSGRRRTRRRRRKTAAAEDE